ncbi:MAG: exodeoxyribonuclease VII large subunit [Acidobacteria bacterium]|nr:exodeoxyribonuclease VII large subunit [Acidobacteriota bacterium]
MLGSELPAGTYTVSQFAWEMKGLLGDTYPSVWIAGEVQRLRTAARGQIYFELVEKGRGDRVQAKLDCVIWADDRPKVEAVLREAGVELSEGVVLRCAGRPDFWPGGGRFQFVVSGVDPLFSLGALERRRRETLRALQAAGLLELNKGLPLAPAPLDVGLVTSEGSAAYHDFLHTLEQSGFGFRVVLVHAAVQGAAAEAEIGRAFELLKAFARDGGRLDAIALIRGGGSRADLATFDSRRVARAVAEAAVPVICGVGHQIDVSISDLVAHTTCKTPTEAAELLVGRVGGAAYGVEETARALTRQARDVLRSAENRISQVTYRFASPSRALLVTRAAHCRALERDLARSAKRTLADAERLERERRTRLLRGAFLPVRRAARQMEAHKRLCDQLSPERTLARGFSLTRRADGRLVRSVDDVVPDAELRTRVRGGAIRSRVLGVEEDARQRDLLSTKERT